MAVLTLKFLCINFNKASGATRAGSLAFTVLLSFVPFTIAIVSVLSWLPINNQYISHIEQYFFNNYFPHGGITVYHQILVFIRHSQGLSLFGFSSLIITSYLMMFAIEKQINALWHFNSKRTIIKSSLIHTLFLFIAFVIVANISFLQIYANVFLKSSSLHFLINTFLNNLLTILLFTLAYKMIPNHKVQFIHALIAAITATIIFTFIRQMLIKYSVKLFYNYHIIYGSLTIAPLLMIWIYILCLNLLFCAGVIYGLESKFSRKLDHNLLYYWRKLSN